jgi:Tol biopolymer transport system component
LIVGVSSAPAREAAFPGLNGRKIVVEEIKLVGDAVYGHVATLNADGSGYGVLRPGPQMGRPRWSPDRKRLVASTGILGEIPSSIKVMNANGSQLRTVFGRAIQNRTDLSVGSPDWLPGGDRIAFLGHKGSRTGIYTIKTDGTGMRKLRTFSDPPLEKGGPTLTGLRASPDGRRFSA